MTKKDFELIARVLKANRQIWEEALAKWQDLAPEEEDKIKSIKQIIATIDVVSKTMSHELASINSLFDKQKFVKACGVK